MAYIDPAAITRAGLDAKKIESIAARLSRAAREAHALGIKVFGGSGAGTLRIDCDGRPLIIADLQGNFDGGDGAEHHDGDIRWGES